MTDKTFGYKTCYICSSVLDPLMSVCPTCGYSQTPSPEASYAGTEGAAGSAAEWNGHPLTGCVLETVPVPAPTLSADSVSIPDRVDLRQHCSPVENQGKTNSCTANAIVGALEYHQNRAGQRLTDLSRMFVYYNARKLSDTESQDTGSFIHHVMAAVLAYGACEERLWPFDPGRTLTQPDKAAYENAMLHEAVQYARAPLGTSALQALAAGLPVVFGAYFPSAYFDEAHRSGVMPVDARRAQRPEGGHAMLLVGYDAKAKEWLVRNSWGEVYADKGYFRIPFDTLASYSDPTHFWTIGAIEKQGKLGLTGPSLGSAQASIQSGAKAEMATALGRLRQDLRSDLNTKLDQARAGFRSRLRGK